VPAVHRRREVSVYGSSARAVLRAGRAQEDAGGALTYARCVSDPGVQTAAVYSSAATGQPEAYLVVVSGVCGAVVVTEQITGVDPLHP
jgi:hypothetical protein